MEKRTLKILISKPAGTAGENSIGYKISLPTSWIDAMGITVDDRQVEAMFYDNKISIWKKKD